MGSPGQPSRAGCWGLTAGAVRDSPQVPGAVGNSPRVSSAAGGSDGTPPAVQGSGGTGRGNRCSKRFTWLGSRADSPTGAEPLRFCSRGVRAVIGLLPRRHPSARGAMRANCACCAGERPKKSSTTTSTLSRGGAVGDSPGAVGDSPPRKAAPLNKVHLPE